MNPLTYDHNGNTFYVVTALQTNRLSLIHI